MGADSRKKGSRKKGKKGSLEKGQENKNQHHQGQDGQGDTGPLHFFGDLFQSVALHHRISVELRGLLIPVNIQVEVFAYAAYVFPAQRFAIVPVFPPPQISGGVQPVADGGGIPPAEDNAHGPGALKKQPLLGHRFQPALKVLHVDGIHLHPFPHGISHGVSSSASFRQFLSRATSSR